MSDLVKIDVDTVKLAVCDDLIYQIEKAKLNNELLTGDMLRQIRQSIDDLIISDF